MIMSWNRAANAAAAIFHSKRHVMNRTTTTTKTTRARRAADVISPPKLALMDSLVVSSTGVPVASLMALTISERCSGLVASRVCTWTVRSPSVVET